MSGKRRGLLVGSAIISGAVVAVGLSYSLRSEPDPGSIVPEAPLEPPRMLPTTRSSYRVINMHEHLQSVQVAHRLLKAMKVMNVVKTVILGGSRRTTHGLDNPFVDQEENNAQMLEAARRWPNEFVPYVTIDTDDPDKLTKLRRWVEEGAQGLKLYSGHGEFHTRPLNVPDMMEVYAFCEAHDVPILFHVNGGRYMEEFEPILQAFPRLQIVCPHLCLISNKPRTYRRLMSSYPELMTDISFGIPAFMNDGLRRVSDRRDSIRQMILDFPERVLWGSDVVVTRHSRKTPDFIRDVFHAYFEMLSRDHYEYQPYSAEYYRIPVVQRRGLGLPPEVLRQIYETNYGRLRAPRRPSEVADAGPIASP